MTDFDVFHHAPIASPREVRLLCLHAGAGDDRLAGRLKHVELESNAVYEALSYEWGSPEQREQIFIEFEGEQRSLKITASLASALKDLRHEDEAEGERVIWVDGICINQGDKKERQHQVFLMGSIYRKAWRVVTYIGRGNGNTAGAIKLMHELWRAGLAAQSELELVDIPERHDPRCIELRKMVLSGWANRAWCAQEFLLNQELVLSRGRHELEWFKLPEIVQLAFDKDIPPELLPKHDEDPLALRESLVLLWRMRRSILHTQTFQRVSLFQLLCNTHPMQASDPRDKVYALLSLASDASKLQIGVDYDCPVEQLYVSVATVLVKQHAPLELLNSNLGIKQLKLPSWVPDWSCWRFGTGGMIVGSRQRASGYTLAHMSVGENSSLLLLGCVIDVIGCLSDTVGRHFVSWNGQEAQHQDPELATWDLSGNIGANPKLPSWLVTYVGLAKAHSPYHDGSTTKELLWCTLTCNTTASDQPADDDYVAYFDAYLSVCHRWKMAGLLETEEETEEETANEEQQQMARSFFDTVRRRMRHRRLGGTKEKRFFGAVPEESRIGDKLCIIEGAKSWYVLRETATEGCFELIGPAYVHGFMNGEVVKQWYYKPTKITLV